MPGVKDRIDWNNVEQAAEAMVGNWMDFSSFAWFHKPENAEQYCIVYISNRDSGLLDISNAHVIDSELHKFEKYGTVWQESHSHWACGHVDGWVIQVFNSKGKVTKAFQKYCELRAKMDEYPVLDESDYSERECDAACENIIDAVYRYDTDHWPEDWKDKLVIWFWDNVEMENIDDRGFYPSEEELERAVQELGWSNN